MTETPKKFDNNKIPLDLLPAAPLEEVAAVFAFGASKYGVGNYGHGRGLLWSRIYSALLRHMFAWWRGEDRDLESGFSHLAHAVCCGLMLLHYTQTKKHRKQDDRAKGRY